MGGGERHAGSRHRRRKSGAAKRPLPASFIQEDAGGHRDVQRFHRGGWDSDSRCPARQLLPDALAFAAQQDGARLRQVGVVQQGGTAGHGGIRHDPVVSERCKQMIRLHSGDDGKPENRSRGGAHALGIVRIHRTLQKDNAAGVESLGHAQDRAGIARVLHSVQHHHQRDAKQDVRQIPDGRPHQRHHPLRGLEIRDLAKQRIGDHDDAEVVTGGRRQGQA